MSNSGTQTTNIAVPPAPNSSDIHRSATRSQHLPSTIKLSSYPSNREGLGDSLRGSGLSFLLFSAELTSKRTLVILRPAIFAAGGPMHCPPVAQILRGNECRSG